MVQRPSARRAVLSKARVANCVRDVRDSYSGAARKNVQETGVARMTTTPRSRQADPSRLGDVSKCPKMSRFWGFSYQIIA